MVELAFFYDNTTTESLVKSLRFGEGIDFFGAASYCPGFSLTLFKFFLTSTERCEGKPSLWRPLVGWPLRGVASAATAMGQKQGEASGSRRGRSLHQGLHNPYLCGGAHMSTHAGIPYTRHAVSRPFTFVAYLAMLLAHLAWLRRARTLTDPGRREAAPQPYQDDILDLKASALVIGIFRRHKKSSHVFPRATLSRSERDPYSTYLA